MALILVVNDKAVVCDLLRDVLSQQGHEVLTATSTREGMQLFQQRSPRITIVDLTMPEKSGIVFLKDIRAKEPHANVIALTGAEGKHLEEQARQFGVSEFVMTGDREELTRRLDRVMQKPDTLTARSSTSSKTESVLVVDDEPMIVRLLSQFLTLRGYQVRTAENGRAALDLVEQSPPDLLVLDLYMPVLNGVELLRELKTRGYQGAVVVLTGSHDQDLLQQTLELGSVDVLGKPVDLERLALVVEVALALSA
jgi:CheY-like chemotaxis protein